MTDPPDSAARLPSQTRPCKADFWLSVNGGRSRALGARDLRRPSACGRPAGCRNVGEWHTSALAGPDARTTAFIAGDDRVAAGYANKADAIGDQRRRAVETRWEAARLQDAPPIHTHTHTHTWKELDHQWKQRQRT